MPLPLRLTHLVIVLFLITTGPITAQEEPGVPPENPSTILVHPNNQGVVAVSDRTRIILVNLSRSREATLRYFWIYNADISPVGNTLIIRGGETKPLTAIKQGVQGRTIGPSTLLVFNNGDSIVSLHKIGD